MDAVFYLLDALRPFRRKSLQEIQEIIFEIGMLGKYGLDINDPQETHILRALPGRVISALQLICIMYAGFKSIEPGMDIGVDLSQFISTSERKNGIITLLGAIWAGVLPLSSSDTTGILDS